MPQRAPRACVVPGCSQVAVSGQWCEEHAGQRQLRGGDERLSAARRGYDHHWRKLRRIILSRRPLCSDPFHVHKDNREVVLATDVHHVVPLSSAASRRELNRDENLMPLCHSCHSRITAGEGRGGRAEGEGGANLCEAPKLDRRPSQLYSAAGFDRGVD